MITALLFIGLLIYWKAKLHILTATPAPGNKINQNLVWLEIAVIITALAQLAGWMRPDSPPILAQIMGCAIFGFGIFVATIGRIWLDGDYAPACKMTPPKHIIMDGPYQIIRHPVYSGTILMGLGFELALYSPLIVPVIFLIPVLAHQANKEESFMRHLPAWQYYAEKTRYKFMPFLY
ncbi:MAG: methyltransferase [Patescibacteria group bacterium]